MCTCVIAETLYLVRITINLVFIYHLLLSFFSINYLLLTIIPPPLLTIFPTMLKDLLLFSF